MTGGPDPFVDITPTKRGAVPMKGKIKTTLSMAVLYFKVITCNMMFYMDGMTNSINQILQNDFPVMQSQEFVWKP